MLEELPPLGEPCDASAEVSFGKSLSRCCQCRRTCEWRQWNQNLPPKKLFCEECRSRNKMVTPRPRVEDQLPKALPSSTSAIVKHGNLDSNSSPSVGTDIFPTNAEVRTPCKGQRINRSAKVKLLPNEEAINLKSVSKAVRQVTHCNLSPASTAPGPLSGNCANREVLGSKATPKSLHNGNMEQPADEMSDLFTVEIHPPGFPSKQSEMARTDTKGAGNREPVSLSAHAELNSCYSVMKGKDLRGKEVGFISRRDPVQEGEGDAATASEKVEAPRVPGSTASGSVPENVKPPPISSSGIKFSSGPSSSSPTIQENFQMISSNHERCLSGPALKSIWKGSFEILDFSHDGRILGGFLAHPAVKISPKAYDFARQIAGVIQFNVHPHRAFWPELFQSNLPSAGDIALYFYPMKIERSKQHYAFLLKYIEKKDLMLRSLMGHVELLVYPSKLLHVDSQKLDNSYFLWGVFRCLKGKVTPEPEALPSLPCDMTANTQPRTDSSRDNSWEWWNTKPKKNLGDTMLKTVSSRNSTLEGWNTKPSKDSRSNVPKTHSSGDKSWECWNTKAKTDSSRDNVPKSDSSRDNAWECRNTKPKTDSLRDHVPKTDSLRDHVPKTNSLRDNAWECWSVRPLTQTDSSRDNAGDCWDSLLKTDSSRDSGWKSW